jgi:protein O-mannosyl-transferase
MQQGMSRRVNPVLQEARTISSGNEHSRISKKNEIRLLMLLMLIVVSIYSNTLHVPFLFDDGDNILSSSHIRMKELSLDNLLATAKKGHLKNRPVANISFALNYYWNGDHVPGYHLVNILVHVISGIFLYLFIRITGRVYPHPAFAHRAIPFFAAAIWLVHPVQTQSVTYIVQRMNSMAAMFYMTAMFFYAKARLLMLERQDYRKFGELNRISVKCNYSVQVYLCFFGSLIAGILAFGTKEIAATLPLFLFLYEWFFFQDMRISWLKQNFFRFSGILVIALLVALLYLGENPFAKIGSMYGRRDFTMIQRLLTEFRVVIFYIGLLLFPHPSRLNLEHDFSLSRSLTDPISTLICLGIIILCLIFSLVMSKKHRLLSFCVLWYFGNLMIESSVIGLEIIFEHRLYLPSMMICLLLVVLCYRYIGVNRFTTVFLCLVVMVFSIWTYTRNKTWNNEITLLTDCVAKSPNKFRPHYNLGIALAEAGRSEEAVNQYRIALRIDPGRASLHTNLGLELFLQGKRDQAIDHYREALRLQPDFVYAHVNLGAALLADGKTDQAMIHCREAIRIKPDSAQAYNCIGNIYYTKADMTEAIASYSRALQIDKSYAEAANNLGVALIQIGRSEQAIFVLQTALKIKPDYQEARMNLERIILNRKNSGVKHSSQNIDGLDMNRPMHVK